MQTDMSAQDFNNMVLQNIRIHCVEQQTSIPKIEKALGYGNGSVSGWVRAKRHAPMSRIEAIAKHLGCSIDDLLQSKTPAPKDGDGLNDTQRQLIDLIGTLDNRDISVLLATAQSLIASHKSQDDL